MKNFIVRPNGTRLRNASFLPFFLLGFLLAVQPLRAQVLTPDVTISPTDYGIGDTVTVFFSVGDTTSPIQNASVLEMLYTANDSIFVDAGMAFDISESWFVSPSDSFTTDMEIRDNGYSLYLKITRHSGTVSGYGKTGGISGIVLTVDDLKTGVSLISVAGNSELDWSLAPNPAQGFTRVRGHLAEGEQMQILDLQGRVLQTFAPGQRDLNVQGLPSGMYLLQKAGSETDKARKLILY